MEKSKFKKLRFRAEVVYIDGKYNLPYPFPSIYSSIYLHYHL